MRFFVSKYVLTLRQKAGTTGKKGKVRQDGKSKNLLSNSDINL